MVKRAAITKSELDRVREFLKAIGATVAAVDIEPGRVRITTTDAEDMLISGQLAEEERAKEHF